MEFLAAIGGLFGLFLALVVMVSIVVVATFLGGLIFALIGAFFTVFFMLIGFFFELFFTLLGFCVVAAAAVAVLVVLQMIPAIALVASLALLLAGVALKLKVDRKN